MANRAIKLYKDFFKEFYVSQTDAVRRKINYCINVIRTVGRVPKTILKNMEDADGLYEIRVEVGSNIFRIFCCFDEGSLVILFNGFQKKTQKTPKQQIDRAKKLMKEYFNDKDNG
ncbi:type II toxin-antitoxin system RelE/ParE family toxin [uncultured Bacteroides sp.]|uniref:type II toxin-antitoxin system RelE/ParE family toxin n=1 Tax=uncultured Bacteroides sp. TaxID=162156 RepID=UPI0025D51F89|nr:type II toxin-antitoxin system RelE/ParE family toxin [uncultured Bacteroides sp.]